MSRRQREEAYIDFVLGRQDHLRRFAYVLCGNWSDADDLLQTALTKLYVAWSRVAKDGNPEAYVRRILLHTSIDAYRGRQRRIATVPLEHTAEPVAREPLGHEDHEALIAAVGALPEMQRKVVVLRHWLGLSVTETATELGISEGTVKSHTSRGLDALHKDLGVSAPP